jgi:hypothetical protein
MHKEVQEFAAIGKLTRKMRRVICGNPSPKELLARLHPVSYTPSTREIQRHFGSGSQTAVINGEATLKSCTVRRGKPFPRAETPGYPHFTPARELTIQGVMIALVRLMP